MGELPSVSKGLKTFLEEHILVNKAEDTSAHSLGVCRRDGSCMTPLLEAQPRWGQEGEGLHMEKSLMQKTTQSVLL